MDELERKVLVFVAKNPGATVLSVSEQMKVSQEKAASALYSLKFRSFVTPKLNIRRGISKFSVTLLGSKMVQS